MSTVAPETKEQPAPQTKRSWGRRARPGGKAGSSVLARGESLVWFTGGALAICLFMIVGLLLLIVLQGVGTFWPLPIVRVELADGTVHMGEVTRHEEYVLARNMLASMSPAVRKQAEAALDDTDSVRVERRLFRTGNFKLTERHFDWVSDVALQDGRETRPEWALLLERQKWGRFYGFPKRFVTRHRRRPSGKEQKLAELVAFFDQHQADLAPDQQQRIARPLEELRAKMLDARGRSLDVFLEQVREEATAPELVAVTPSGSELPLDEADAGSNVVSVNAVRPSAEEAWQAYREHHADVRRRFRRIEDIKEYELGELSRQEEHARLAVREAELEHDVLLLDVAEEVGRLERELADVEAERDEAERLVDRTQQELGQDSPLVDAAETIAARIGERVRERTAPREERLAVLQNLLSEAPQAARQTVMELLRVQNFVQEERVELENEIDELRSRNEDYVLAMETAQGQAVDVPLGDIVRAYPANQLTFADSLGVYFSRWGEFLTDDPREANSEGGVFPAIWGTVAMTLIMSLAVVPFGVLAALYLREYATAGPIISAVRIAVNNLAGVPSIVFGVFGLGFFCYIIGAYVDGGPANAGLDTWSAARWLLMLAAMAVTAVVAFFVGLLSVGSPAMSASRWRPWLGRLSFLLWIVATGLLVLVLARTPFFDGFFRARLPNPTFGKGGLLWAACTLALLTLPVVIIATEEALSAVPNSMREGSYACGASKWQTIRRIVLPRALPGITTGMILAMARGAGEVAPLMLVGAVKIAPHLPVDTVAPFVHAQRSFMHLGFHIFDLGFKSQNSEAAKPMVYTTTLLLISIVAILNVAAVFLRSQLRKKFQSARF